jgi:hypothetical protein
MPRGAGSPDSDSSTPEDGPIFGRTSIAHSLPLHLFALHPDKNVSAGRQFCLTCLSIGQYFDKTDSTFRL